MSLIEKCRVVPPRPFNLKQENRTNRCEEYYLNRKAFFACYENAVKAASYLGAFTHAHFAGHVQCS